jgi:hypothetical protein
MEKKKVHLTPAQKRELKIVKMYDAIFLNPDLDNYRSRQRVLNNLCTKGLVLFNGEGYILLLKKEGI